MGWVVYDDQYKMVKYYRKPGPAKAAVTRYYNDLERGYRSWPRIKGFDRRGRKFEAVKPNPFKERTNETRRRVVGSKGQEYWVDDSERTCTCPGYTYRGACKHLG